MNQSLSLLTRVLAWLLAAFFVFGAYGNVFISEENAAAYVAWGYPGWFHYVTGTLELAAGWLLIRSSTRHLGAALGALVMAAATLTTLVNTDYAHSIAPSIVLLASLITLGLSLIVRRTATANRRSPR